MSDKLVADILLRMAADAQDDDAVPDDGCALDYIITAGQCRRIAAFLTRPEAGAPRAEVRLNDNGTLDEVVCRGDQLEQMDYNHWFLSMGDVAVWLHAKGKITASYERRTEPQRVPE